MWFEGRREEQKRKDDEFMRLPYSEQRGIVTKTKDMGEKRRLESLIAKSILSKRNSQLIEVFLDCIKKAEETKKEIEEDKRKIKKQITLLLNKETLTPEETLQLATLEIIYKQWGLYGKE